MFLGLAYIGCCFNEQESSASLKEPLGEVYSENSINFSSSRTEAASGESSHTTRQLTEGSNLLPPLSELELEFWL